MVAGPAGPLCTGVETKVKGVFRGARRVVSGIHRDADGFHPSSRRNEERNAHGSETEAGVGCYIYVRVLFPPVSVPTLFLVFPFFSSSPCFYSPSIFSATLPAPFLQPFILYFFLLSLISPWLTFRSDLYPRLRGARTSFGHFRSRFICLSFCLCSPYMRASVRGHYVQQRNDAYKPQAD